MEKNKHIGQLLCDYRFINNDDLEEALAKQKKTGLQLGETLIKLGKVSRKDIEWILSKQVDIPFVLVESLNHDAELINKFPQDFLVQHKILPVYEKEDEITIVTDDPFNNQAFKIIQKLTRKRVVVASGGGQEIVRVLSKLSRGDIIPLVSGHLKNMVDLLVNSSFYRLDFVVGPHDCSMSVYGFDILRKLPDLPVRITSDTLFKAFDYLKIPFLYEKFEQAERSFISIYPVTDRQVETKYPALIGNYGLTLPSEITFTNAYVHQLPTFFYASEPVPGYPYLSTRASFQDHKKMIYLFDSAMSDDTKFYTKVVFPKICAACQGGGCQNCREFGYTFESIAGLFSYQEFSHQIGG